MQDIHPRSHAGQHSVRRLDEWQEEGRIALWHELDSHNPFIDHLDRSMHHTSLSYASDLLYAGLVDWVANTLARTKTGYVH